MGLLERAPLAAFDLPASTTQFGDYAFARRYPDLAFAEPLYVAPVPAPGPSDRLIVAEQRGTVVVFPAEQGIPDSRLILDISPIVEFDGEQGLLGLAFDPDFADTSAASRFVYLHYSATNPRRSVISRFTWVERSDVIDPTTELVLLEVAQPYPNHNGGMLSFGPDGYLYIAFGDGGSAGDPENHAQNTADLLGTILRIDVANANAAAPYAIPADNPFAPGASVDPGNARAEIWAYGLRNPFRFSFDTATSNLWVGDVGQGAVEEVDIIRRGGNYGWRVFEGSLVFDRSGSDLANSAFSAPAFEYARDAGQSITGGEVYRGSALPGLTGWYVYGDFVSDTIWALLVDANGIAVANNFLGQVSNPTFFGKDAHGELLVVSRTGALFGLTPVAMPPTPGAQMLSATGLFTDLANLVPASGLVEYEVIEPFWSDGTSKRRWIGVPDSGQIRFNPDGAWVFPQGTVLVKHFEITTPETERLRLETRVFTHSVAGWQGVSYRWNQAQTDAELIVDTQTQSVSRLDDSGTIETFDYVYPSRAECLSCHTAAAGRALGVNTRQLNRQFDYPAGADNQLASFARVGLFSGPIGAIDQLPTLANSHNEAATLQARARSYLDTNCANCHRPRGPNRHIT